MRVNSSENSTEHARFGWTYGIKVILCSNVMTIDRVAADREHKSRIAPAQILVLCVFGGDDPHAGDVDELTGRKVIQSGR